MVRFGRLATVREQGKGTRWIPNDLGGPVFDHNAKCP
jgi:hypothetical protein